MLATRGVDRGRALPDPLPARARAGRRAAGLTLVAIATQDPLQRADRAASPCRWSRCSAILVGLATEDRARSQWRALAAAVRALPRRVRGLPTLVAFRRAERAVGDDPRDHRPLPRAHPATRCGIAFASSAVLELVATLSVALVAVTVGLRLAQATWTCRRRWSCCCSPPRPTGRCAGSAPSSTRPPRASRPSRRPPLLTHGSARRRGASPAPAACVRRRTHGPAPGRDRAGPRRRRRWPSRPAGVTAVIGPSGCGKSTLLAGARRPARAQRRARCRPAGPRRRPAWRAQVAWLPQRPVFVAGTVADNLRLAAPDADRRAALGRAAPGGPRRACATCPAASTRARRGRRHPLGRRARPARAGPGAARGPAVGAARRAHRAPRRPHRAGDRRDRPSSSAASRGVVVVAHRPALVAAGRPDRHLPDAPGRPARPRVPAPAAPPPRRRAHRPAPAAGPGLAVPSTSSAALASASGVALTATAGWLIVQASYQPGDPHPAGRDRRRAHLRPRPAGAAVRRAAAVPRRRPAAARRSAGSRCTTPSCRSPRARSAAAAATCCARRRRRRRVLDRELRVRLPVRGFVLVAAIATVVAAFLPPAGGVVVALACLVAGGLGYAVARLGAGRAERRAVDARAELSDAVVEATQTADELVMWQAEDRALSEVAAPAQPARPVDRRGRGLAGCGPGLVLLVAGVGVALTALLAPPPSCRAARSPARCSRCWCCCRWRSARSRPVVADAGALAVAHRSGRATADRPGRPHARRTRPGADRRRRARTRASPSTTSPPRWDDRAVLRDLSLELAPGDRVAWSGRPGRGRARWRRCCCASLDPRQGEDRLGGQDLDRARPRRRTPPASAWSTTTPTSSRARSPRTSGSPVPAPTTSTSSGRSAQPASAAGSTRFPERPRHLARRRACPGLRRRARPDRRGPVAARRPAGARPRRADRPPRRRHRGTSWPTEVLGNGRDRTVVWITHGTAGLDLVDRVVDLDHADRAPVPADAGAKRTDGRVPDDPRLVTSRSSGSPSRSRGDQPDPATAPPPRPSWPT